MYLICPNCAVSYTVDGVNIGSEGRAVRCSECGHTWKQFPAPAEPVRAMKPSVSESPDVARQPVSHESSATFDPEQQLPPVESPIRSNLLTAKIS